MIRTFYRASDETIKFNIPIEDYSQPLADKNSFFWVDISDEPRDTIKSIYEDIFRFHPLSITDALDETHVSKVDNWEDYMYLVSRALSTIDVREDQIQTQEVDIFIGKNYIVTYQTNPIPSVERVWQRLMNDDRMSKFRADQILYTLLDEIAQDFLDITEKVDEELNAIEDQLFEFPKPELLEMIFSLKRDLLHLRRIIVPQREMMSKLGREDYEIIDVQTKVYFRDVYDHYLRLYDIIDNLRELTGSTLEIYLSVVNNRMNNVMKTLTIITTLFMPITFLAGFFGMNFFQASDNLLGWTTPGVFLILVLVTVLFPFIMYLWIHRQGWLN